MKQFKGLIIFTIFILFGCSQKEFKFMGGDVVCLKIKKDFKGIIMDRRGSCIECSQDNKYSVKYENIKINVPQIGIGTGLIVGTGIENYNNELFIERNFYEFELFKCE